MQLNCNVELIEAFIISMFDKYVTLHWARMEKRIYKYAVLTLPRYYAIYTLLMLTLG